MLTFDILKKVLSWVDLRPRKRVAQSPPVDEEFVTPKKLRRDHTSTKLADDLYEINDDSDNEDVEVGAQYKDACNGTRLNSTYTTSKDISFKYSGTPSPSTRKSTPVYNRKLTMGCTVNSKPKTPILGECGWSTLAQADRLRSRSKYKELIQNFLPQRIQHVIHDKAKESQGLIETIDLDSTPSSSKGHSTSRIQELTPHSHLSSSRKSAVQAEVITIHDAKKDKAEEAPSVKPRIREIPITITKPTPTKRIECVVSNSLRDQFAAQVVIRKDFIPQIAKTYDDRIERSYHEAEKLRQVTCALSKYNRFARKIALEKELARSMRSCEAVLDEREEPEEPEEAPLPTLTEGMLRQISNALIPRPPDQVVAEGFGLRITRKDIHTLANLNWLNDEVINYYMNLLIARGGKNNFPKVHAMNTFFYPKLVSGGHASLKRWTRKVDVFAQDLIVVPIHLSVHWCMSVIDFRDKTIRYYDSMGSSNPKCLSTLRQYLEDESLDKKKQPYNTSDWKLESVKNIPQQMNGCDCGVFSCMFAEYECANRKITFTQEDMPYFRQKMVYEILESKLL